MFNYKLGADSVKGQYPNVADGQFRVKVRSLVYNEDSQNPDTLHHDFLVLEYEIVAAKAVKPTKDWKGQELTGIVGEIHSRRIDMSVGSGQSEAVQMVMAISGIDASNVIQVAQATIDDDEAAAYKTIASKFPEKDRAPLLSAKVGDPVNWSGRVVLFTEPANPARDRLVDLQTNQTTTKRKQRTFQVHNWAPVPEAEQQVQ